MKPAAASRKLLFWLVFALVVLNIILFLKFGLNLNSGKSANSAGPHPFPQTAATNVDQE